MYSSIKNNIIRRIRTAIDLKRENIFLKQNDFKLSKTKDSIGITNNKVSFTLRKMGSDWRAFKQIFQYEEYKPVVKALKLNKIVPTLILDLGANIGLASIYLKTSFPESEIICVEPDENNFKQLRLNTNNLLKITLLNVAVWNKPTSLVEVEDEPFRGGEDWSKSFKEQTIKHSKVIEGLSINQILKKAKNPIIDLLKIDIEGAERFIFNKEISDLTFLKVTRCIAIEIHDEFGIREEINQILTDYNFVLFEAGELTIGVKNEYRN